MSIAAIDLGRRRIGVAVTDAENASAYPLGTVERVTISELERSAA